MTKAFILSVLSNSYSQPFNNVELIREGGCISYCVWDFETIGALIGQLHNVMHEYKGYLPKHGKDFFIDRYINILTKKIIIRRKQNNFVNMGMFYGIE